MGSQSQEPQNQGLKNSLSFGVLLGKSLLSLPLRLAHTVSACIRTGIFIFKVSFNQEACEGGDPCPCIPFTSADTPGARAKCQALGQLLELYTDSLKPPI